LNVRLNLRPSILVREMLVYPPASHPHPTNPK
jgi:hypothetical protein